MRAPPPISGTPEPDGASTPARGPDLAESGQESPSVPQPPAEVGVTKDMATLAINPRQLAGSTTGHFDRPAPTDHLHPDHLHPDHLRPEHLHTDGNFADLDDAAVMLELRAGNMAAFDFLLAKYRKPIIHFMFRMVHNQAVAEELAQEVFLRIYRSRETYRAEARFSTWLYRIATNLGVNHARDTKQERSASTIYLDETDSETGVSPDLADSAPGAESSMLRRERLDAIRDVVLTLPERQRVAVLMHKYEEMDYRQIGDVLKLSESATKSLLFRAYQTLRERLKDFL